MNTSKYQAIVDIRGLNCTLTLDTHIQQFVKTPVSIAFGLIQTP